MCMPIWMQQLAPILRSLLDHYNHGRHLGKDKFICHAAMEPRRATWNPVSSTDDMISGAIWLVQTSIWIGSMLTILIYSNLSLPYQLCSQTYMVTTGFGFFAMCQMHMANSHTAAIVRAQPRELSIWTGAVVVDRQKRGRWWDGWN